MTTQPLSSGGQLKPGVIRSRRPLRAVATGLIAAASTAVVRQCVGGKQPDSTQRSSRWQRTNFRGDPVSLAEGPGIVAGLIAAEVARMVARDARKVAAARIVAIASAGALGLADDLGEPEPERTRGLRGHLRALRSGRLTTGAAKLFGIGASSIVAATVLQRTRASKHSNVSRGLGSARLSQSAGAVVDIVADTVLIAGAANLVNLLDLRPGRALKAATVLTIPVLPHASDTLAVIAVAAPADLHGTQMAGDAGANALGAAIGSLWAAHLPRPARIIGAITIAGLNLASERVSFSQVIRDVRVLRVWDEFAVRDPEPPR